MSPLVCPCSSSPLAKVWSTRCAGQSGWPVSSTPMPALTTRRRHGSGSEGRPPPLASSLATRSSARTSNPPRPRARAPSGRPRAATLCAPRGATEPMGFARRESGDPLLLVAPLRLGFFSSSSLTSSSSSLAEMAISASSSSSLGADPPLPPMRPSSSSSSSPTLTDDSACHALTAWAAAARYGLLMSDSWLWTSTSAAMRFLPPLAAVTAGTGDTSAGLGAGVAARFDLLEARGSYTSDTGVSTNDLAASPSAGQRTMSSSMCSCRLMLSFWPSSKRTI